MEIRIGDTFTDSLAPLTAHLKRYQSGYSRGIPYHRHSHPQPRDDRTPTIPGLPKRRRFDPHQHDFVGRNPLAEPEAAQNRIQPVGFSEQHGPGKTANLHRNLY